MLYTHAHGHAKHAWAGEPGREAEGGVSRKKKTRRAGTHQLDGPEGERGAPQAHRACGAPRAAFWVPQPRAPRRAARDAQPLRAPRHAARDAQLLRAPRRNTSTPSHPRHSYAGLARGSGLTPAGNAWPVPPGALPARHARRARFVAIANKVELSQKKSAQRRRACRGPPTRAAARSRARSV